MPESHVLGLHLGVHPVDAIEMSDTAGEVGGRSETGFAEGCMDGSLRLDTRQTYREQ